MWWRLEENIELFVWSHEVLPACVGDCPGVKGQGRGGEGPYLSDEVRILIHNLSKFYLTRYGYMESKEGTAALQTEEGIRRKIKKAVMDFQVGLQIVYFVVFIILITSRHLLVWTRQELWMAKHEKWWRHRGENWLKTLSASCGDSLWCWLTP